MVTLIIAPDTKQAWNEFRVLCIQVMLLQFSDLDVPCFICFKEEILNVESDSGYLVDNQNATPLTTIISATAIESSHKVQEVLVEDML